MLLYVFDQHRHIPRSLAHSQQVTSTPRIQVLLRMEARGPRGHHLGTALALSQSGRLGSLLPADKLKVSLLQFQLLRVNSSTHKYY